MFRSSRRFIAGAVCPRCARSDKLVVFRRDDSEFRECVSCGFLEEMHFPTTVREPDTRVNLTREQKEAETGVVRILDAPADAPLKDGRKP